jgi:hypothetical protein
VGFDSAEFGLRRVQHDGVDAHFGEEVDEIGARLGDEFVGKEIAIAENDSEGEREGFH